LRQTAAPRLWKSSRKPPKGNGLNTRAKIKAVATKLLITHGVRGFSYAHIAKRLHITTTNVHHHVGNKQSLVEVVVREYVADASLRHKEIWTDPALSLTEKIQRFVAFNFERYKKFNVGTREGRPWSLIGRLRLDTESLSANSVRHLASFGSDLQAYIHVAVTQARESGELSKDAPINDIGLLLANMVNSTAIMTQVAGNFLVVREVFESVTRVIMSGYGPPSRDTGNPSGRAKSNTGLRQPGAIAAGE
jgi:AcrR family transcriptional regulator